MKGISTVIGSILMLLVVIVIGGSAYLYSTGAYTQQTQGIELIDSSCSVNVVTMKIRNVGTNAISQISCTQTAPAGDNIGNCQSTGSTVLISLEPGTSGDITDTCSGSTPRSCIYRLTPPVGRSVVANVFCV